MPRAFAPVALLIAALAATPAAAQPRQHVFATGSSTVAPFTRAVAATLREGGSRPAEIRVVGTVGGFAEFCQGAGLRHPDIQNASRRMTRAEFTFCASRGVHDILEIPIGHDGIVVAHRAGLPSPDFRLEDLWRGLAKEVPSGGRLQPNPHTHWNQVNPRLPAWPIRMVGPPATSGTRESFAELALLRGCAAAPEIRAIADAAQRRRACTALREDGRWIEAGEDDEDIVARVAEGPEGTLGMFGFGVLETHRARVEAASVEGVEDTRETIASGRYPLSRPLYLYVKRANLDTVPPLGPFLAEYLSDRAMGPGGYLLRRGLVPLDEERRRELREAIRTGAAVLRQPES